MKLLRPIEVDERIAVVITTKNRPNYLVSLLTSLVHQTYERWALVVNDQSDVPVEDVDTVGDLLQLLATLGHEVIVFHSQEPRDRYQRVMERAPEDVEFLVRVDDDVVLSPSYLERILAPFHFFPERPVAAVGGCLPEPHMGAPHHLGRRLADPDWVPRIDRPTWRLQGHAYRSREILTVESLWGSSMCYRRSAAEDVGGWFVEGQTEQVFREDSDMSARWRVAGYDLLLTTDARGRHLVAPSGGARSYRKSPSGNVLISDRRPFEADDRLFRQRLETLLQGYTPAPPERFSIEDLERGDRRARPLVGPTTLLASRVAKSLRTTLRRLGINAFV